MHATEENLPEHRIRPMKFEDVDPVLSIERASFAKPWTRSMFLSELKNPVSHSFVVRSATPRGWATTAYIIFWVVQNEAHILDLAVHPGFRRRGIGRMLLETMLERMEDILVAEVFLEVRKSNREARRLYRELGFREAFERKNYYGDEDAVVMTYRMDE